MRNMRTYTAKKDEINRKWFLVDADGLTLGRLASKVAAILRGKNKPEFTPSMDTGDFVVVINSEKIKVTGSKEVDKKYYRYTGYAGGMKSETVSQLRSDHPERLITYAVQGMLPKTSIGDKMLKKLKVCVGDSHPYQAQKPELITL